MMQKMSASAVVAGALLWCGTAASPALATNLLANGSFETPDIASAQYLGLGSTTITGWTVGLLPGTPIGTSIQFSDNAAFCNVGVCSSDGNQFLDLTGSVGRGGGVFSDDFATIAGATYSVSFDVGAFNVYRSGNFGDATVDLYVDGIFAGSFTNVMDLQSYGSDWLRFSHSFTGTGSPMSVGLFASLATSSSNLGVGLDHVSVDLVREAPTPVVPEPASWAMMIGGFGLAGGALRSGRNMRARFA